MLFIRVGESIVLPVTRTLLKFRRSSSQNVGVLATKRQINVWRVSAPSSGIGGRRQWGLTRARLRKQQITESRRLTSFTWRTFICTCIYWHVCRPGVYVWVITSRSSCLV